MKRIKCYWLVLLAAYEIIALSTKILILNMFGLWNKEKFDRDLVPWGKRTLQRVGAKVVVKKPPGFSFEPGKRYILVSNHASLFDTPLIYGYVDPPIRMVAKRELLKVPIWGHAIKASGAPVVDRHNRKQAIKDFNHMKKLLEEGIKIWLAPEGTRSLDGKLLPFKKGPFILAIQTEALIIPIALKGTHELMPSKSFNVKYNQTVEIVYGDPIDASQYSIENKEALVERAHQAVNALLENED